MVGNNYVKRLDLGEGGQNPLVIVYVHDFYDYHRIAFPFFDELSKKKRDRQLQIHYLDVAGFGLAGGARHRLDYWQSSQDQLHQYLGRNQLESDTLFVGKGMGAIFLMDYFLHDLPRGALSFLAINPFFNWQRLWPVKLREFSSLEVGDNLRIRIFDHWREVTSNAHRQFQLENDTLVNHSLMLKDCHRLAHLSKKIVDEAYFWNYKTLVLESKSPWVHHESTQKFFEKVYPNTCSLREISSTDYDFTLSSLPLNNSIGIIDSWIS